MNVSSKISRGLERLMCAREGARLEGMHGLAGMGCAETFSGLQGLLDEMGFEGVDAHVRGMRRAHGRMCEAIKSALPVAADAMRVQEMGGLGSIFSKIKKLHAKTLGHRLATKVLAAHAPKKKAVDPAALAAKRQAKADKKAARKAAKEAKRAAKAAAALQAANAQNLPPAAAGAAVLANESGVNLATPDAQQFAQDLVSSAGSSGGGGGGPATSMQDPGGGDEAGAADDGTIFGIPKPWAIGGGVLLAVGVLAMSRRRGR